MADPQNQEMFDRILRHLDAHPELTGDVQFETTPTAIVAMSRPRGLTPTCRVR